VLNAVMLCRAAACASAERLDRSRPISDGVDLARWGAQLECPVPAV